MDFWRNRKYDVPLPGGSAVRIGVYLELSGPGQSVPSPVHRGITYPAEIVCAS